jgi:hypothetical protein
MFPIRFNARLDTSHHGLPHPFKGAGVVVDILTQPQCDREVRLLCQQELHSQGILGIATGKNPEALNLPSVEAMQWILLCLSVGHDRCY